jgi:hypothetical protein
MRETSTASTGRTLQVRAESPFRYGSLVAQLENDRFNAFEGDEHGQQFRRGHNAAVEHQLRWLRADERGLAPQLFFVDETKGDDKQRAYARGRNHGTRHVQDLLRIEGEQRVEAGLRELAHAPVISTVELHTEGGS